MNAVSLAPISPLSRPAAVAAPSPSAGTSKSAMTAPSELVGRKAEEEGKEKQWDAR